MKVAILSANLGSFDKHIDPVKQVVPYEDITNVVFHRFTDENFPPITGLTPRLQYRIPKLFGWEMFSDYDFYLWLDSSMTLEREDSLHWFLSQLKSIPDGVDAAFFKHPWRKTIKQEVEHIEDHLQRNKPYIVSRYKNGLHREFLTMIEQSKYVDDHLFASTAFIYRNNEVMKDALERWWFYQSRYFTCDQVQLPFALWEAGAKVKMIDDNLFKNKYISLVSHHK